MPELTVTLSSDKMIAYISGGLDERLSQDEAIDRIMKVLAGHGVVFGIQEQLVASAAAELLERRCIRPSLVAIGEHPTFATQSGADFTVPTYPQSSLPDLFLNDISAPVQYHLLGKHIANPHIVLENEEIGTFEKGSAGAVGTDVLGRKAASDPDGVAGSDDFGQGLLAGCDTSAIVATLRGIVVRDGNRAWVLPVELDAQATFAVSADRLTAVLSVLPPGPGGKNLVTEDVMRLMHGQGIVFGIDKPAIEQTLSSAADGIPVEERIIARGKAAIPGEDARISFAVDLSFSQAPAILDDGRADYYTLHLFENVKAGQSLANIVPATDGVPGRDVFGDVVEALRGKEMPVVLGSHVSADTNDPNTLIATHDGHVYLRDGNLLVEQVLYIKSDVDFSTGNLDFNGDIVIDGDVKAGFSINAAGSVSVRGTVEDASIDAGQSVIVHGGFVGKGKGRIKAGGDVVVKHVLNQTVMAKNNIMIAGEAVDASLYAGNEMFVEVRKSWVLGGTAVARNKIRVFSLGSPSHTPTEISSGINMFVDKILEELEKEIKALEQEKNIIASNEARLKTDELPGAQAGEERRLLVERLNALAGKHERKIAQLRKYRTYHKKSLYDAKGDIGVTGTVYPGVLIKIGNRSYLVEKEFHNVLFYAAGTGIRVGAFPR